MRWLPEKLDQSIKTNHLGGLSHYKGCAYTRDHEAGTMLMHQRICIDELVECFGVTASCLNPSSSPDLVRAREVTDDLVEELLCIAYMARPDVRPTLSER